MKRMALFVAPLALCGVVGCNDRDGINNNNDPNHVYDGAPSSPLGWPSGTVTPGLGEGEREQPIAPNTGTNTGSNNLNSTDSTGTDAMGSGAPATGAPAGGSMDMGGTGATGVSPPAPAGSGATPLPSGDASSGNLAPAAPSTGASGATGDAIDQDLNNNGIDDDEENEQGNTPGTPPMSVD